MPCQVRRGEADSVVVGYLGVDLGCDGGRWRT